MTRYGYANADMEKIMRKGANTPANSSDNLVQSRPSLEERIWDAAKKLFSRYSVGSVPVEMIADHARTNTEAVLRHFHSREHMMARYVQELADMELSFWYCVQEERPNDALDHIRSWIEAKQAGATDKYLGHSELSRAAAEVAHRCAAVRSVIRNYNLTLLRHLAKLCRMAGYHDPDALAAKIYMLVEGARVGEECIGPDGPASHLVAAADAMMASHDPMLHKPI